MRKGKGIGIMTLIRLRRISRHSLDAILGLDETEPLASPDELQAAAEELARRVLAAGAARHVEPVPDSPRPPVRKAPSDAPRSHRRR